MRVKFGLGARTDLDRQLAHSDDGWLAISGGVNCPIRLLHVPNECPLSCWTTHLDAGRNARSNKQDVFWVRIAPGYTLLLANQLWLASQCGMNANAVP